MCSGAYLSRILTWRTRVVSPKGGRHVNQEIVNSLGRCFPTSQKTDAGRAVLHARYKEQTVTIGTPTPKWDPFQYPILRWDWKVIKLPDGADETVSARNDTAAAVYVFWKKPPPFVVSDIKYTWSTTLPVGTTNSKRFGNDRLRVVESGPSKLGQWSKVSVNVKADYEAMFSEKFRRPVGIALMTDADRSPNGAEAYFGPFWACKE